MCDHKLFRCTNGLFFCLQCGAEIPNPYMQEGKPEEKKPAKRRTKKEVEKE